MMKTSPPPIRLHRALNGQSAMLAKRLGVATASNRFPQC
jgi:hypothetical protein